MKLTILKQIIPLAVVCSVLLGYQYMGAVWDEPGDGTLAETNTLAPINVGSDNQVKNGGLSVDALAVVGDALVTGTTSSDRVFAREYCDENGENCGSTGGGSGVHAFYDSPGTYTFTVPAGVTEMTFEVAGAGGGGGGGISGASASDGDSSTVIGNGLNIVALGGAGGISSVDDSWTTSLRNGQSHRSGTGGDVHLEGKGAPGGMAAMSEYQTSQYDVHGSGQPGLHGGLVYKTANVIEGQTYEVTVGTGGSGQTSSGNQGHQGVGADGASGYVKVYSGTGGVVYVGDSGGGGGSVVTGNGQVNLGTDTGIWEIIGIPTPTTQLVRISVDAGASWINFGVDGMSIFTLMVSVSNNDVRWVGEQNGSTNTWAGRQTHSGITGDILIETPYDLNTLIVSEKKY